MPKFEYNTLEELQLEVRKGKLNEDLLDWESNAKISEWLAKQPNQAQHAALLHEVYQKAQNDSEQLKAILKALSFSEHEIESLLEGVSIEAFQKTPLTLEDLNKQVNILNHHTIYLDNFKAVIGSISLLPAEGIPISSGWIPCEGQRLSTKYFEVLFNRLGTSHGGDGKSYFAIPNLKNNSICKNYKYYLFTGIFGNIPQKAIVNIDNLFSINGINIDMILVKGGTFMMGNVNGNPDEQPMHSVTLSSYYIGKYPVTQALWKAVMDGDNPSYFKGDRLPVESVSYNDCEIFLKKINTLTGKEYRFPTEAEWEFAAQEGNRNSGYRYSGSDSLIEVGWYNENNTGSTHPVGEKRSNGLNIYDMSGNIWEWCHDWKDGYDSKHSTVLRVIRGGSWQTSSYCCRVTFRNGAPPNNKANFIGFRLALSF